MSDLDRLNRASDEVDLSPLTYEPHFGLKEKAFSLLPNARFFSRNASNGTAFDDLLAGIRRREGILALTGEVGTGKTTLCRAVLAALDRKTFAAFVPDPIVSREDLLMTLLVDFGVVSIDEIRGGHLRNASRAELAYPLHDFLTALQPLSGFAVVMIDEAQSIPNALLEEIRILSDMENGQKLLQVLLIGQPELEQRLAMPEMRQLAQRLTVRCELQPLAREDVMPYITHRLSVAGRSAPLFHNEDEELIWRSSGGIPRVINVLCDRTLARAARAGAATVTTGHIVDAVKDLKLSVLSASVPPLEAPPRDSSEPVLPKANKVRHGLPADYRMRHDAHYVEELTSARGVAPADPMPPVHPVAQDFPVLPVAQDFSLAYENEPTNAARASRRLPGFDSELDEASKAEFREFEKNAREAAASRRRSVRVAAFVTLATIAGAVGTWTYLSSSARGSPERRTDSTRNSTTPPRTGVVTQPPEAALASGAADEASVREPELSADLIGRNGFAIQMATFSSAQRAAESVQQLRTSGYRAYDRAVTLRDGAAAHVVFLGPYATFQGASSELDRARQLPDYTAGRIVAIE